MCPLRGDRTRGLTPLVGIGEARFRAEPMTGRPTMSGCRPESHVPIPVNTYLELWLQILPTAPRIFVELAAVRWVRDGRCGLEFLSLRPGDRGELQEIIEDIERPSSTE